MKSVNSIRNEIKRLYETKPNIHVDINLQRPKLTAKNLPVIIKGVYSNIFRIAKCNGECYSIQYTEVLNGQVTISELNNI